MLGIGLAPPVEALVVTEIMYDSGDTPDHRPFEYIELYNENADPLDLGGFTVCNGIYFEFPKGTWLNGRSFLVLCASEAAIRGKYGITNTLGDWFIDPASSPSLSNAGERIEICNPGGRTVVEVRYNDRGKWPVGADGTGHSLEIRGPFIEVDDPDSWTLSNDLGGSPGVRNPSWDAATPPRIPVRINEAFLLTGGAPPWLELYNASDATVSLAGYHVTDDAADLGKATLPAGTSIAARGFLVLSEADLGFPLALTTPGTRKFLALSESAGRVVDAFNFEPQYEGYSEGRVPGDDRAFNPATDPTPGAPNAVTVDEDIVINEILYHPIDEDRSREFIELHNRGSSPVDLSGWQVSDGVRFAFEVGTTIPAGGYLVVARDPARIRAIYGLDASHVVGPATQEALDEFGFLADAGERVTVSDAFGRTVDTVRYHDGGEWSVWADGGGSSLELIDPRADNRRAAAWDASDDSGKAPVSEHSYIGRHVDGESELHVLLLDRGITLVDDLSVTGGGITTTDTPIIESDEVWRYFKGTQAPPATWKDPGFNDSAWLQGAAGFGYSSNSAELDGVNTILGDMLGSYMTVFARKTFTVADRTAVDDLVLTAMLDDGIYVYLNGTQVASSNVTSPAHDASAQSAIEPTFVTLDLTASKGLLVDGANVLAIQVHNYGTGSSDLVCVPRLVDRTTTMGEGTEQLTNGTFDADQRGWMIEGNHIRSGRTTQDPIRGAGSLKLIATGRGDNKVNRLEAPEQGGFGMGVLSPNEDVEISFKARWVVGSQSLLTHGDRHEMARSHRLAVPEDLGTPGAINSVTLRQIAATGGNLGPVIHDVKNDPAVPAANAQVTVTAKIVDPDGVESASLWYSLTNPSASPTRVAMTAVGDDAYRATIPGQASAARVIFYITATDAAGATGRYPVDIRERSHPLLLNPPTAGLNDQKHCIYRHDVKNPSTPYASYRFWMSEANAQELNNRRRLSNDPLEGSFVFGGEDIYYGARARFSGSPWARAGWGGSFRLYLPKDNPLHGRIRKFNIEDNQGNPLDARTRISHYLLRQSQGTTSVPYSEDFVMVRWQLNDRTSGTREHNWAPDGDFISRWFPGDDEGDFFEMDDRFVIDDNGNRIDSTDGRVLYPTPSSRSDGNGENKENYRWFFNLRAKRGADDYTSFTRFAKLMDPSKTANAAFDQQVWDQVNVEELLRVFAIEFNIDDWDTWGCSRGKNCYFYRPEEDGRWHLLMWDTELTYGSLDSFIIPTSPASAFSPGGFSEVNRFVDRPEIKRRYYAILKEMVVGTDRWFHSSFVSAFASRLATFGMQNTGIATAGGYIDQKASLLATRIQAVTYPSTRLAITTNGGNDLSTAQSTVSLAGTAPVDAVFLLVDGVAYPASYSTMTAWTIPGIPLVPGPNVLGVDGFDMQGRLVDSDSITVTSTQSWGKPALTRLDPDAAAPAADIRILGSEFHPGVRVFFGALESPRVVFDEGASPGEVTARVPGGAGTVDVTVRNLDQQTSNALPFTFSTPPSVFTRGDANGDGRVDISDPVRILFFLFLGSGTECADALDADDSEAVDVTDAVRVLDYLFRDGPAPAAPFPTAGTDPGGTELGCER